MVLSPELVKRTFTLIEMLIVIVIIGILAAALIPRLQSVQARARDTKRKADLRTIYNANEIYILDNGSYPPDTTPVGAPGSRGAWRHSYNTGPWIPELTGILTSLPLDPINALPAGGVGQHSWSTGGLHYTYHGWFSGTINTYDLVAQLENTSDPDRAEIKVWRRSNDVGTYAQFGTYLAAKQVYDLSPNVKNQ